jgi:hypothetical protein
MRLPSVVTRAPKSSSKKLVATKLVPMATAAAPEDREFEREEDEPNLFNQADLGQQKAQTRS